MMFNSVLYADLILILIVLYITRYSCIAKDIGIIATSCQQITLMIKMNPKFPHAWEDFIFIFDFIVIFNWFCYYTYTSYYNLMSAIIQRPCICLVTMSTYVYAFYSIIIITSLWRQSPWPNIIVLLWISVNCWDFIFGSTNITKIRFCLSPRTYRPPWSYCQYCMSSHYDHALTWKFHIYGTPDIANFHVSMFGG